MHRWWQVPAIIATITVWFADVLFGGRSFYARDIFNYHYPMKRIVRDTILAGEWPMWSPNFAAGQPMAANPAYEVFYPPQLLVLLPDFHFGFTLHVVVHFYICAIGLYLLLRSFDAGAAASLLGAVGYTLGGPYLSLVRTLPFLFSLAWAPLIFLFARRYLIGHGRRDLFLTAIFGGLQALVAEPTTMLQTWLIVGAYAGYRIWREPATLRRNSLGVAMMGAGSAVIGAAQVVPMLDFVRDSVRSQPLDWTYMISKWSLAPGRLLELFYPLVFQSLSDFQGRPWISSMYNLGEPFVSSFYPGFAVGILFVSGFVAWRRGSGFVLLLCGALYILAIGRHTPLLRVLFELGLASSIRYAEKFAMGASLVVVIWAALTADLFFRGDTRVRRAVLYTTIAWFVVGFFLILVAARVWTLFWVITFVRGLLLLALLYAMRRWKSPAWGFALVVITALDVIHLRSINPTIERRYFDPPAVTQQLSPDKDSYRIFHHAEWDWSSALPNADAYFWHPTGRWWTLRNSLMTRNGAWWGYRYVLDRDYDVTLLENTQRLTSAMFEMYRSRRTGWEESLMAMSNAWYHGRFRPAADEVKRTAGRWEDMQPVDFLPAAEKYPRFYFADQIEQINSAEDFVARVLRGGASKRVAFVDWQPFRPAAGVVHGSSETSRSARIEVEAPGRSLLMISITGHQYWRATVGGESAEIRPVNLAYQAIEVPAGRHVVELEYWNPWVVPSLVVSLAALLRALIGAGRSPVAVFDHRSSVLGEPERIAGSESRKPKAERRKRKR